MKNREMKLGEKRVSTFRFGRIGVLLLLSFLGVFASANAAEIKADVDKACPGDAIVLTATGFDNKTKAVNFYAIDGDKNVVIGSSYYVNGKATAVYDMKSSAVSFYAVSQETKERVGEIVVKLNTDCPNKCHQSSTGDYINGTDFNPSSDPTSERPDTRNPAYDIPLQSYFGEYDVQFTVEKLGASNAITNDIGSFFGTLPVSSSASLPHSNYYWINGGSGISNAPFSYNFHLTDANGRPIWDENYYRMKMKVYMMKMDGQCDCSNALFKLSTDKGSDGNFLGNADNMEIIVYDDKEEKALDTLHIKRSFAYANIGHLICNDSYNNRLIRLEIFFYGKFSLKNKNANEWIKLSPSFQQMGNCMKIAVDYVSAEIMSVCMDNSSVCVGEDALVVAAGFPYNSKYVWEYTTDGGKSWQKVVVDGFVADGEHYNTDRVNIHVDFEGKRQFRVYDKTTVDKTSEYIYFTVTGKNCEPLQPTELNGKDFFCVPGASKFSVSPVDINPDVTYSWKLIDPSGKEYFSDKFKYDDFGELDQDARGASVTLTLNRNIPDGIYRLVVQPVKKKSDGTSVLAGDPISKEVKVFKTANPTLSLICEDCAGKDEADKQLCPTDKSQRVEATTLIDPNSPYVGNYVFTWTNAAPKTNPAGKDATVDVVSPAVCEGTQKTLNVAVTVGVKIDDTLYCPTSDANNYKIKDIEKPKITCSKTAQTETLGESECKKRVTFKFPAFTAGCTTHPSIKVELTFKPADGSATITKVIEKESIAEGEIQSFLNKAENQVQLPAGSGTVKYTVKDDCNNEDVCSQAIEVKDVTAPKVNCDAIKVVTVKLSEVGTTDCQANAPAIAAPKLTDNADPCSRVVITGVYEGRTEAQKADIVLSYDTESARKNNYKKATAGENPADRPFDMGYTYILWSFTDASGNTSYCTQKVVVVDDKLPTVNCPDYPTLDKVDNQEGECGLSVDGLLAWLEENSYKAPSATDVCSGKGSQVVPDLYYAVDAGALVFVKPEDYKKIIFLPNKTYTLVWRFKKSSNLSFVDDKVYVDCELTFVVKDTEAPQFDCASLPIVRATANKYKPKDKPYVYLTYASKNDVTVAAGPGPAANTYEGALKEFFANGDIKMLTADMAQDNCAGDLTVTALLSGPDENKKTQELVIKSTADLEKVKYGIGVTTITFTFTDKEGNSTSCQQYIVVTSGATPIPNCSLDYATVEADDKCDATYTLKVADVPTAKFPVDVMGFYFNLKYAAISGLHFAASNGPSATGKICEDVAVYFPDNITGLNGRYKYQTYNKLGVGKIDLTPATICEWTDDLDSHREDNKWSNFLNPVEDGSVHGAAPPTGFPPMFPPAAPAPYPNVNGFTDKILEPANTYTTIENYTGYPSKIILKDSEGNVVKTVLNPYTDEDIVPTKRIVPRAFDGSGKEYGTKCDGDYSYTCGEADLKIKNNFVASDLVFDGLTKGDYEMIFWYEDKPDGEQTAYCTRLISVVDKISPSVTCGNWNAERTLEANAECVVPTSEVDIIKKPTAADLNASDNCAEASDLKITVSRENFDGSITLGDAALNNPLPIGTTTIIYTVSDGSEYSEPVTCKQKFIVEDKMGPEFDCKTLIPITAYADENCSAPYANVELNGLKIPYAKQDPCSPSEDATEEGIEGVPTRSDGKNLKDPFDLKDSPVIITWTFTDGAGNKTVCEQSVTVVDTVLPKFDCSAIEDVDYKLDYEECEAKKSDVIVALGEYSAADNCSGKIVGVPYLYDEATGDTIDLPESFESSTKHLIIWKFTDEAGNVTTCEQNLTITDANAPRPGDICPKDIVVEATEETMCSLDYDKLKMPTAESLAITDPCDGKIVPELEIRISMPGGKVLVVYGEEEAAAATYPVGVHKAYWIYKDKAVPANSDTCIQTITVLDKIDPMLVDCDDAHNKYYRFTVDAVNCEYDPVNVNKILVHPKAYDACDGLLSGDVDDEGNPTLSIDPIIERYDVDTTTTPHTLTLYADGVTKMWDADNFKKGLHMLKWIFKDKSDNESTCEKYIHIIDATGPSFDCSKINPDTLRPEAMPGMCVVDFATLKKDVLDGLAYKAYDACSDDSIPGVLTLNGLMELPDDYTMQSGITYKLLWLFVDEDGNRTTCPQWILPSHNNPVDFDCSTLEPLTFTADKGECFASPDSVKAHVSVPQAKDACSDYMIKAQPFFINGEDTTYIDLDKVNFPTGDTVINWRFVSIWNIHDTLWCRQPVSVNGNKNFDIDCDVVSPTLKDTIEDCGPSTSAVAKITTPWVADPCADPSSPDYKRYGVGVRADSTAENPVKLTDPYPLGNTVIKWVFTDFTSSVKDSCEQTVNVRTNAEIVADCESLLKDTIKSDFEVPDGICTATSDQVGINPDDLVVPAASHPCLEDVEIIVYPRRVGGREWSDDYIVGVNWIEWVFIDPSHTVIKDTMICRQPIQVGDNNATLFDCDVIQPKRIELDEANCTIDATALNFAEGVPPAHDACGETAGELITPDFRRTSGLDMDAPFGVGRDTIVWHFFYTSINDSVVCRQPIHVLDSKEPIFDCSILSDLTLPSEPGKCYLESREIISVLDSLKNVVKAADACDTTIKISGKYDESVIPSRLEVGDTVTIHWVFQNEDINLAKKECDQRVTVIGDKEPIFDCEAWPSDTFLVVGCDTTLKEGDIRIPNAVDACTGDSVVGVGSRLDGGDLYGLYPVGTTAIRWTFTSPYSSKTAVCDKFITVLTKKELDFDCTTLKEISVRVAEGECSADTTVNTPVAKHPCPDESGVVDIKGVPSLPGASAEAFVPNADSTQWTITLPTGSWNVTWTFADHSWTMVDSIKTCAQNVQIGDVNEMPVDCENYPDTVIKLPPTDCDLTWTEIGFKAPSVVDLCSKETIVPELSRFSGESMDAPFTVGIDTVYWSYTFSGQTIVCRQAINLLDSVAPDFDCSTLEDIQLVAKDGFCTVSSEELVAILGNPVAIDSCTKAEVPGQAFVANVPVEKVSASVGDTLLVHWVFIDSTLNAVAKECDQTVYVLGRNKPIFDCSSLNDTVIYLALDVCELDGANLKLEIPVAKDSCTGIDVPGVASRQDGKLMTDIFEKGTTVVDWTFKSPHSITPRVCPQNVVVKDTFPPVVVCEAIMSDTVRVKITSESELENGVTAAEAEKAGLKTPSVEDACDVITVTGSRDDGKPMDAVYPLKPNVTVTWTFEDASGNKSYCSQVVVVEDWVLDSLICPKDLNDSIKCIEDLPLAYTSYEEFVAAGGSFSNEEKFDPSSFEVLPDEIPEDHCKIFVKRTYQVTDVRKNKIQCHQLIEVNDDTKPVFSAEPENIKLACTDEIPQAVVLTAVDNCKPTDVTVNFVETSSQSDDPNSCEYYNYTITRVWSAKDLCDNEAVHTQLVEIVDTMAPEINFPPTWKDTVLSIYNKGCTFGVPDFTVEVKSIVSDNCTDASNIKVTQSPEANTLIINSTTVTVYVQDMCGNVDSLFKHVLVPTEKQVVNLDANDTSICARDKNPLTLWSQEVRFASGKIYVVNRKGEIIEVPTTFVYDCYLDSISPNTLVYSNNPNTYLNRFSNETLGSAAIADSVRKARIELRKRHQSGHYWFVAMDTLTLCSDTAHSFLDVRERPRISMESGIENVCEYDLIDTLRLNSYLRCVDDKGAEITADGWLLNGVDYKTRDSLFISDDNASLVYYAENECGRSTSLDSYYNFCMGDSVPKTHADSMKFLGADSAYYYLFRTDDYKVRDSILVDVYERLRSENIFVTVNEKERSTIWLGDVAKLNLYSNYKVQLECSWYAVNGKYDRRDFVGDGNKDFFFDDPDDEQDELMDSETITNGLASFDLNPRDTTAYYVVLSNKVCPSISGNVVTVNVNDKLPTAITPFMVDGMNDCFMKSYPVKIFNRYSSLIFEGPDGWDGTTNGAKADPGVYFYEVTMRDGTVLQGTIEIVLM